MIAGLLLMLAQAVEVAPSAIPAPVATAPLELQVGTPIPLVIKDHLSTKTNARGDLIHMEVAADISAGGQVVIPKGSAAIGEITRCETKGAFGKSGKLEARALYVTLGDRTVRISGALSARGRSGTTETVLTGIAAGLFAFAVTGKSAEVQPGTIVQAILDRTVRF